MKSPPSECPVCGAAVPPHARACPECGADERTGWNEENTRYDGLDLPDSAFGEESPSPSSRPQPAALLWWVVAAALLLISLFMVFG